MLFLLLLKCFLPPITECQSIVGEGALRFFRNGVVDNSTAINFDSGIVQILTEEGNWGNICIESGFSKTEADVICRQLGYGGASSSMPFEPAFQPGSGLFPATTPFDIDGLPNVIRDLSCDDSDISVTQCSYNATTEIDPQCQDDFNDVIVTCVLDSNAVVVSERKGNVRLRDGLYSNDGLLEVYCGSEWGTVCIEGFSDIAALLACGQLGYNSYKIYFADSMNGTSTNVPIWYNSVFSLIDCSLPIDETIEYCLTRCNLCRDTYSGDSTCTHNQNVILVCNYNTSRPVVGSTNATIEECAVLNDSSGGVEMSSNTYGVITAIGAIFGALIIVLIVVLLEFVYKKRKRGSTSILSNIINRLTDSNEGRLPTTRRMNIHTSDSSEGHLPTTRRMSINTNDSSEGHLPTTRQKECQPTSIMEKQDTKPHDVEVVFSVILSSSMIKPTDLKVIEKIGQGEFGVVYRGLLTIYEGKEMKVTSAAVKTLKGKTKTDELIVEAEKMIQFDHFNVLSLYGICVGLLESPCIVMPFMSNGSLLSYLRKESADLTISDSSDENLKLDTTKQLLSMCLQVAKGMAYLTEHKFVHRDLAARNCMISADGVIKVADFGLAEDVYTTEYFKQKNVSVKLPFKWMALESIHYGKFSEKSDVWSFGVLCWEVFSVGKSPYPGMAPLEVVEMLDSGRRLSRPLNAACCDKSYELIILSCWEQSPDKRPHFFQLIERIEQLLGPMADYVPVISC